MLLRDRLTLAVNILRTTIDTEADPMRRGFAESYVWHTFTASQVADELLSVLGDSEPFVSESGERVDGWRV